MYIIIYDFGTSSVKTCLFNIDSEIHIVANSTADYGIYITENGGAEQDTEEWWEAICSTTRALFDHSEVKPDEIHGALIEQIDRTIDLVYTKYMKARITYDRIQRKETIHVSLGRFPRDPAQCSCA